MMFMLKIAFKEPKESVRSLGFSDCHIVDDDCKLRLIFDDTSIISSITKYIPTQDPMLDRSEILKELGISKEEDDVVQAKYSIEHVKPTDL